MVVFGAYFIGFGLPTIAFALGIYLSERDLRRRRQRRGGWPRRRR